MNRQQRRANEKATDNLANELAKYVNGYFKFIAAHPNQIELQEKEMRRMNDDWRVWCNNNSEIYNVFHIAPMFITEVNRVLIAGSGIEES